ncbi:MAG: hypothetical protein M3310_02685 [Actinomycetota bacterium]|nr:hypothetical protein [Actinomycetota bacterium]
MTVEPTGEKEHLCACCGDVSHTVWGWVHDSPSSTRACYGAGWVDRHEDKVIRMTLSFGLWGAGTTADDRKAVAVEIVARDGEVGMVVAEDALFDKPDFFGRLLSRDEALSDAALADLWKVADAVVENDPRVARAMSWLAS